MTAQPILEVTGISKSFSGVVVLRNIDLTVYPGEVHGIVGQNGAGKSTLMKILNGVYTRDSGTIRIGGQEVHYDTPLGARKAGIAMVFQEFSLIPTLTVAQNVFLTREPRTGALIDDAEARRRTRRILEELGVDIDPDAVVATLSVGSRQLVEIAKALSQEPRILILDEPTASLSHNEIETLFGVIHRLEDRGIALLYISHHLRDLLEICDRVTVLRDGQQIFTRDVRDLTLSQLIQAMLGTSPQALRERSTVGIDRNGQPLLEVRHLSSGTRVRDASFKVWPGEVLGIAGLLGSGRSELIKSVLGLDPRDSGEIIFRGRPVQISHMSDAVSLGMSLVPEDRRSQGLILEHSVESNMLLPVWSRLASLGLIDGRRADQLTANYIRQLNIKTRGPGQIVRFLSGGNQQKVVIGKSLSNSPTILFLDEPTFGIDVQSKREIMDHVRAFADAGNAVVFVDSELEQLSAVCDRILILHRGRIAGEVEQRADTPVTEEYLLAAIQEPDSREDAR